LPGGFKVDFHDRLGKISFIGAFVGSDKLDLVLVPVIRPKAMASVRAKLPEGITGQFGRCEPLGVLGVTNDPDKSILRDGTPECPNAN